MLPTNKQTGAVDKSQTILSIDSGLGKYHTDDPTKPAGSLYCVKTAN